jgi:hypothetical protein
MPPHGGLQNVINPFHFNTADWPRAFHRINLLVTPSDLNSNNFTFTCAEYPTSL